MSEHKHQWKWQGGGIGGKDFDDQMYCKKECRLCHLKRAIKETANGGSDFWEGRKRDDWPKEFRP
jgi:hypothetical protein